MSQVLRSLAALVTVLHHEIPHSIVTKKKKLARPDSSIGSGRQVVSRLGPMYDWLKQVTVDSRLVAATRQGCAMCSKV